MTRILAALVLVFAAMQLAAQQPATYQRNPDVTVDPKPGTDPGSQLKFVDYFRGRATFPGTREPADVTLRHWSIAGSVRLTRFPEDGFLIVELRGGHLVTVIGGERRERLDGDIWTVPADATMSIETGNDMAVIEVMAVKP